MADSPPPKLSIDDLTSRLLGWNSPQTAASQGDKGWSVLHFQVRTTTEGLEAFKRAMKLLSGQDGYIVFQLTDENGTSSHRDPLLVIRGYFRLLRFSLEPIESDSPGIITENEWTQFTKALLKNLGGALKSGLQQQLQCVQENNKSSQQGSFNRLSCAQRNNTVLHYFRSMIDHVVPHVGRNTAILGSTYKLFSELAGLFATLLETESTRIGEHVQSFLPVVGWTVMSNLQQDVDQINSTWEVLNDCLKQAVLCLIEAMNDGLISVQRALSREQNYASKPEGYSRIMIFMIARAVSFIFLRRKRFQHMQSGTYKKIPLVLGNAFSTTNLDEGETELIRQCLLLLVKIRSLSVLVSDCLENPSTRKQLDITQLKLFEMIDGLGQKVDVYAAKLICLDVVDRSEHSDSIRLGLKCLADLPSEEFNVALNICDKANRMNYENAFPLGKLFLVKHILQSLSTSVSGVASECTNLLGICQSTIFEDMPRLYHFLQIRSLHDINIPMWASKFVSDMVRVLSNCTRLFFMSPNGDFSNDTMIRQHQIMVRWLMCSQGTRDSCTRPSGQNHPFSNEIIMCILQVRILSLNDESNQDSTNLLSLMVKLLLHQKTETSHRGRIAAVLSCLLRSSPIKCGSELNIKRTRIAVIKIMWRELNTFFDFDSTVPGNSSGKIKRKRLTKLKKYLSAADVCEVSQVLAFLIKESILSRVPMNSAVIKEMRLLWDNILTSNNNKISRLSTKQIIVLLLLSGTMRCQPNIASIQQILHDQDIMNNVAPTAFIDGSLTFVGSLLLHRRHKDKLWGLHYACVQFIKTLILFLGSEFSESHIIQIGNVLNRVDSMKCAFLPERLCIQHVLVSASCKMGSVIKPNFSTESVKPLLHSLHSYLKKDDWFFLASCVSQTEQLARTLPDSYKGLLLTAMSKDAQLLLGSRIKGTLFCIESKQTFDNVNDLVYSFTQESTYMMKHFTSSYLNFSIQSCLGDKIVEIKAGSLMLFRPIGAKGASISILPPEVRQYESLPEGNPQLIASDCKMFIKFGSC